MLKPRTHSKTQAALAVALILLGACTPYKYIDVEYYDAPKRLLPSCLQGIVLLSNLAAKSTSTAKMEYQWALDSVASSEAVLTLADELGSSPLYAQCPIATDTHVRTDSSNVVLPLRWELLEQISARNHNAPLVLSLEYMRVGPRSNTYPVQIDGVRQFYGYLEMDLYYYWRVYDLRTRHTSNTYLKRDTLTWQITDWLEVKLGDQLPGVFTAAAYSGADAAKQYIEPYMTRWNSDRRLIYCQGGKAMAQAYHLAAEGKWLAAAEIWQKLQSGENKRLASMAAFNLALVSELYDHFEAAYEWLQTAQKLCPSLPGIPEYLDIISERQKANCKEAQGKEKR